LKQIGERLVSLGWVGDDLSGFIQTELAAMLLDDPRMSAERLASLLAARGKTLPAADAPT
jgi:hypothetical protein